MKVISILQSALRNAQNITLICEKHPFASTESHQSKKTIMHLPDTVFVCGAGFNRFLQCREGIKFPLTRDFLQQIAIALNLRKEGVFISDFSVNRNEYNAIWSFIEKYFGGSRDNVHKNYDLEEILTLIEMKIQESKEDPYQEILLQGYIVKLEAIQQSYLYFTNEQ